MTAEPTPVPTGASAADLADQVGRLTDAVTVLTERLAALEARLETLHPSSEVPDEVLLAIAAACAAFLGKRATVKQVHLRRHTTWAKQGRAEVQYSHAIRG